MFGLILRNKVKDMISIEFMTLKIQEENGNGRMIIDIRNSITKLEINMIMIRNLFMKALRLNEY